jgi:hypothetical protein
MCPPRIAANLDGYRICAGLSEAARGAAILQMDYPRGSGVPGAWIPANRIGTQSEAEEDRREQRSDHDLRAASPKGLMPMPTAQRFMDEGRPKPLTSISENGDECEGQVGDGERRKCLEPVA